MRRKASEIPKAELVGMIAKLRGALYQRIAVPQDMSNDKVHSILEETTFDDDLNETYSDGYGPKRQLDEYELMLAKSDDMADRIALKARLAMKDAGVDPDGDWTVTRIHSSYRGDPNIEVKELVLSPVPKPKEPEYPSSVERAKSARSHRGDGPPRLPGRPKIAKKEPVRPSHCVDEPARLSGIVTLPPAPRLGGEYNEPELVKPVDEVPLSKRKLVERMLKEGFEFPEELEPGVFEVKFESGLSFEITSAELLRVKLDMDGICRTTGEVASERTGPSVGLCRCPACMAAGNNRRKEDE